MFNIEKKHSQKKTRLVTHSILAVLVYPLVVLVSPLVVLVFPLVVLVCPFVCPFVVLVCPLVVSVCPLVVFVVLSVGLFITDQNILGKLISPLRTHCEIFLSDYFMKQSLMHISLHLV